MAQMYPYNNESCDDGRLKDMRHQLLYEKLGSIVEPWRVYVLDKYDG